MARESKKKGTNPVERMRIEYVPLDVVAKWPRNPKLHADAELDESFERFGFVAPAIRDERMKRLVAGHGRLDRLLAWRQQGKPAPRRIEVAADGAWLMPVVCGIAFANEQEAEAYLLADNQITMLRGWDGPKLKAIGDDLINGAGLLGTGFDEESIRAEMEARASGADIGASGGEASKDGDSDDEAPEIPTDALVEKWKTATGQLWEITGPSGIVHRVLCGDCRDPENVKRLHRGKKPKLGLHDPPYGINIVASATPASTGIGTGKKPSKNAIGRRGLFEPITGDAGVFDPRHLFAASERVVLWGANNYPTLLSPSNEWIAWDKRDGMGENDFSAFELAYVSPTKGKTGHTRVIRHLWNGLHRASEKGEQRLHPTQKPIEVQKQIVEWYSTTGDDVADWYMGAGAVIIACELTGRVGHGMDIAPAYVAATLERMTARGCKARLVS